MRVCNRQARRQTHLARNQQSKQTLKEGNGPYLCSISLFFYWFDRLRVSWRSRRLHAFSSFCTLVEAGNALAIRCLLGVAGDDRDDRLESSCLLISKFEDWTHQSQQSLWGCSGGTTAAHGRKTQSKGVLLTTLWFGHLARTTCSWQRHQRNLERGSVASQGYVPFYFIFWFQAGLLTAAKGILCMFEVLRTNGANCCEAMHSQSGASLS